MTATLTKADCILSYSATLSKVSQEEHRHSRVAKTTCNRWCEIIQSYNPARRQRCKVFLTTVSPPAKFHAAWISHLMFTNHQQACSFLCKRQGGVSTCHTIIRKTRSSGCLCLEIAAKRSFFSEGKMQRTARSFTFTIGVAALAKISTRAWSETGMPLTRNSIVQNTARKI